MKPLHLLLPLLICTPLAFAADTFNRPQLKPGTLFETRHTDMQRQKEADRWKDTLVGMENGLYKFESRSADGTSTFYKDENLNPVRLSKGSKEVRELYRWPLTIGESHRYSATSRNGMRVEMQVTVAGVETLTFQGKPVTVTRHEYTGTWTQNGQTGKRVATDWLSPELGWVVRSEYKDFTPAGEVSSWWLDELVDYRPGQ